MDILEEIYRQHSHSEALFPRKKILFIGSESYDAPVITVLQGLVSLGFTVYTIRKWNINSWFCNVIIDDPLSLTFDFVLSNLHWGTRWKYYRQFQLSSYPKIMIDGDDNRGWPSWRDKYEYRKTQYVFEPPTEIKERELAPYRWIEDIDDYTPDVVFTAQKQFADRTTYFLPFGIQNEYFSLSESKTVPQRTIDIAHLSGPGRRRKLTQYVLAAGSFLRIIPGRLYNSSAQGDKIIDSKIQHCYNEERSQQNVVHGYFRWTVDKTYFRILNDAKLLIYPGIDSYPFWDSKRPWEGYASGCLVLLSRPTIDVSEFPLTELEEFANYSTLFELISKCRFLIKNPEAAERYRLHSTQRAAKFFSPVAIARYFLGKIAGNVKTF